MTLLEMIKKWEGVKSTLEEERNKVGPRIMGDIEVANDILKDLHSLSEYVSEENIREKVLKKMDEEAEKYEYGSLEMLARVYSIMST